MSMKLNAEELAAKRYITMPWEKEDDRRLFEELNAIAIRERQAYAAAIREVAQQIADERNELLDALMYILWQDNDGRWRIGYHGDTDVTDIVGTAIAKATGPTHNTHKP